MMRCKRSSPKRCKSYSFTFPSQNKTACFRLERSFQASSSSEMNDVNQSKWTLSDLTPIVIDIFQGKSTITVTEIRKTSETVFISLEVLNVEENENEISLTPFNLQSSPERISFTSKGSSNLQNSTGRISLTSKGSSNLQNSLERKSITSKGSSFGSVINRINFPDPNIELSNGKNKNKKRKRKQKQKTKRRKKYSRIKIKRKSPIKYSIPTDEPRFEENTSIDVSKYSLETTSVEKDELLMILKEIYDGKRQLCIRDIRKEGNKIYIEIEVTIVANGPDLGYSSDNMADVYNYPKGTIHNHVYPNAAGFVHMYKNRKKLKKQSYRRKIKKRKVSLKLKSNKTKNPIKKKTRISYQIEQPMLSGRSGRFLIAQNDLEEDYESSSNSDNVD